MPLRPASTRRATAPRAALKRDGKIRGEVEVAGMERPDHWLNWLQCMRTGETPHASIDAGYQHAVAVLMAVISYDPGRKSVYDPAKRTIKTECPIAVGRASARLTNPSTRPPPRSLSPPRDRGHTRRPLPASAASARCVAVDRRNTTSCAKT
jgi:hypothetical protein